MITQPQFSLVLGVVLSLLFTITPGIKDWFEVRRASEKQQIMAILLITIGIAAAGLSCAGILTDITCTPQGLKEFFFGVVVNSVLALTANQATYTITKNYHQPKGEGTV